MNSRKKVETRVLLKTIKLYVTTSDIANAVVFLEENGGRDFTFRKISSQKTFGAGTRRIYCMTCHVPEKIRGTRKFNKDLSMFNVVGPIN